MSDPYWLPRPIGSGAYREWLMDEGSLTSRLKARCSDFNVRNVRLSWEPPLPDEAGLLGLRPGTAAWIREVWLQGGERRLVFARSVLPHESLVGAWRGLVRIGNRPLGAALFADTQVMRRPLSFRRLRKNHPALRSVGAGASLWARRSVFVRKGRAILVTEAFLPEVLAV
jgi:chorismate--pyruvate lyase